MLVVKMGERWAARDLECVTHYVGYNQSGLCIGALGGVKRFAGGVISDISGEITDEAGSRKLEQLKSALSWMKSQIGLL